MSREIEDAEIARYLKHEVASGRHNTPSFRIINSLLMERDFHFKNECDSDQECITLQIENDKLTQAAITCYKERDIIMGIARRQMARQRQEIKRLKAKLTAT
jgi:hypothetical protein